MIPDDWTYACKLHGITYRDGNVNLILEVLIPDDTYSGGYRGEFVTAEVTDVKEKKRDNSQ